MEEQIDKIKTQIEKLKNKDFNLYFYAPDLKNTPNTTIYEVYKHVSTLRNKGYNAYILVEEHLVQKSSVDVLYQIPTWFEQELRDVPHISMKGNINISPSDFLFMLEYFPSLMMQFKDLPCEKIVLFYSYHRLHDGFIYGSSFDNVGFKKVLTVGGNMKTHLMNFQHHKLDIKTYRIGTPSYFFNNKKSKSMFIPYFSRNNADIQKVVSMFYLKYPQFSNISFENMFGYTRMEFAEKLKNAPISLFLDRIASFGSFPLESMAAGAIPVGLIPDMPSDYMTKDNGIWVNNILEIPDKLSDVILAYLTDEPVVEEVISEMGKTAEMYNVSEYERTFMQSINEFISDRITLFNKTLQAHEEETQNK